MLENRSFLSLLKNVYQTFTNYKIKHSGEHFHALTPDNITARRKFSRRAVILFYLIYLHNLNTGVGVEAAVDGKNYAVHKRRCLFACEEDYRADELFRFTEAGRGSIV